MLTIIRIIIIGAAFFLTAGMVSVKKKIHILDAAAVSGAFLLLVLYVLAMFRGLGAIDIIAGIVLVAELLFGVKLLQVRGKDVAGALLQPELVTFCAASIIVTFLVKDQVFSWWDDINFWSSDAKALYFLGGFPGKYGNVSPEFGDYPPMTSLFKWLFLHFSDTYCQGLQFAGYYVLNALFLLPLGKMAGRAHHAVRVLFTVSLFMIPSIVSGFVSYGTPGDVTMGIVYGALLLAIWDRKEETRFYYVRIAAYTAVLLLTKNVGIEWAVFALLFYFLINGVSRRRLLAILAAAVPAGAVYGSWLLFCLLNRRVAKLTGAGLKMAVSATKGGYTAPDNTLLKMQAFLKGFALIPMHTDKNISLDLSALALVAVFAAVLAAFGCLKVIGDRAIFHKIIIYFILTGIAAYGIIFIAHITIFATEDQYLDAGAMALSIARYGAPFEIGGIYLLMGILMEHYAETIRATSAVLACIAFTVLTADYSGLYQQLIGYHSIAAERAQAFESTIDEDGRLFLDTIEGREDLWGHRILFVRDGMMIHQVKDAYISNEASPIPIVYADCYTEGELADTEDTIRDKIRQSHAEYVYVQHISGDSSELFRGLASGCAFEEEHLYRVEYDGNGDPQLAEP